VRPGHDLLRPFHDAIAQWAAEGLTLREIALWLGDAGCPADHNRVALYCKAHGITIASKSTGRPPRPNAASGRTGPDPVQHLPVVRARSQAPVRSLLPVLRAPSWLMRLFGRKPMPLLLPEGAANNPITPARTTPIAHDDAPPRTPDTPGGPSTQVFNIALQLIVERGSPRVPIHIDIDLLGTGASGSPQVHITAAPNPQPPSLDTRESKTPDPPSDETPNVRQTVAEQTEAAAPPPLTPASTGVASWSDEEVARYADVLALFQRIEIGLQSGNIASIERDCQRFCAWMLAEGSKAPAWLREAAQQITYRAEEALNRLRPDEPMPLMDSALGQPQLMIFLAERRYHWA
jgi:hypothetical protein